MRSRRPLAGLSAFALLAASPSLAATIEAASRIDAVAVHPDGAVVTRLVEVDVPAGATTLVLRGQRGLDGGGLRIEGEGESSVTVTGYDLVGESAPAATRALVDERVALQARLDAAEAKRKAIQKYAEAGPGGDGNAARAVDEWAKAWDALGSALERVNAEITGAQIRLRQVDESLGIQPQQPAGGYAGRPMPPMPGVPPSSPQPGREAQDEVQRRLAGMTSGAVPPWSRPKTLSVTVEAASAGKVVLRLSHQAPARWQPFYEARLDTVASAKPSLEIVRKALISQDTSEDWADVAVRVETAPLHRRTEAQKVTGRRALLAGPAAPSLAQRALSSVQGVFSANEEMADMQMQGSASVLPRNPVAESAAGFDARGTRQSYVLPGRMDLAKAGMRTVRLAASTMEPTLRAQVAPRIDPAAYLTADFRWDDAVPLFEGPVSLVRDGAAAGSGTLPFLRPGESHAMGFGADDLIRVEIGRDKGERRESGVLGVTVAQGSDVSTSVTNRHAAPVEIKVSDAVPVADGDDVKVEGVVLSPPPDENGTGDDRGVAAWKRTLASGERLDVRVAYTVKSPASRPLRIVPR